MFALLLVLILPLASSSPYNDWPEQPCKLVAPTTGVENGVKATGVAWPEMVRWHKDCREKCQAVDDCHIFLYNGPTKSCYLYQSGDVGGMPEPNPNVAPSYYGTCK